MAYASRVEHAQHVGEGADRGELARKIMRRQAALGLRIAAVFILILVGLPLLNLYLPDVMATKVGGFSFTWLLLAVLFYPITWVLSWLFVKGSDRIEAAIVSELRGKVGVVETPGNLSPRPPLQDDPLGEGEKPAKKKLFVEEDEA